MRSGSLRACVCAYAVNYRVEEEAVSICASSCQRFSMDLALTLGMSSSSYLLKTAYSSDINVAKFIA